MNSIELKARRRMPPKVFDFFLKNRDYLILAGGAVRSMAENAPVNDWDFYMIEGVDIKMINVDGLTKVFKSENAISYQLKDEDGKIHKVQVITKYKYTETTAFFKSFDFVHCMGLLRLWKDSDDLMNPYKLKMESHPEFLASIASREIRYSGSEYPIASLVRVLKYMRRGYTIRPIEMLKLGMACSRIQINDVTELKSHLMGVDVMYLIPFMKALDEDPNLQGMLIVDGQVNLDALDREISLRCDGDDE